MPYKQLILKVNLNARALYASIGFSYYFIMQGGSSVEKNLKDFEALLEKCSSSAT
jgi:hypothetical protein